MTERLRANLEITIGNTIFSILACVKLSFIFIFRVNWNHEYSIRNLMTDMDLIWAQDYEIGFIGASWVFGFVLTSFTLMQTPDIFGRKPVLFIAGLLSTIFPFLTMFNKNLTTLYAYCFLFGFSWLIRGTTSYVLVLELVPKTGEKSVLSILTWLEKASGLLVPITFYITRDYRYMLLLYFIISMYATFHVLVLPESPKFYYGKHKYNQCRQSMNKISKINTKSIFNHKFAAEM